MMPSDKRNSIIAIATGLISSLFNVALSQEVPSCQPQQLQSSAYIMVLPKLTFVLLCILPYHVGDDLQYMH